MFETEKECFKYVRDHSEHKCQICGKYISEPIARCFAHASGKGMDKENRTNPRNIILVCGIDCHRKVDELCAGIKFKIKEELAKGKHITIQRLLQLHTL